MLNDIVWLAFKSSGIVHVNEPTGLSGEDCKWHCVDYVWGTGIRGLMRSMATLPQGNQELLVVRDKAGRPPGEFGVSKSMECDIFPSVI